MTQVLVVGKPNSGKSLLFNKLTGLSQKVANFPGVTVEVHRGHCDSMEIVDFPGVYSLNPFSEDEKVAIDYFKKCLECRDIHKILCVLDATRLERSLILALQVKLLAQEHGIAVHFALNMIDQIKKNKLTIDTQTLSDRLGAPISSISARTGEGMDELRRNLKNTIVNVPVFENLSAKELNQMARELALSCGPQGDLLVKTQNHMDEFFLSSWLGGVLFFMIMLVLFQSIFTWSTPFMDMVEGSITWLGLNVTATMPDGALKDFFLDAIFGGVGSFLVFVPQIAMLTFIIGLLEDSGYLARAALICHRPLSLFGLSGKSFVPFLTGHACAIPAIYAARTIESRRKRFLTIFTIPFMACSARLPVYSLLVAVFIPATPILGGFVTLQGLTFFSLYLLGILAALATAAIMSRFQKRKQDDLPFVLELPPYRLPSWNPLLRKSLRAAKTFIVKAGWVIFLVTAAVWFLGYFPHGAGHLQSSYLGMAGKSIEPLFAPLGLDWRYGVAILTSFLAREVFVGTLGTFYGIDSADENITGLASQIQADDITFATGLSLLVFYAIALQCVSTLAVMKHETGSIKYPIWAFIFYFVLAYVLAIATYQLVQII